MMRTRQLQRQPIEARVMLSPVTHAVTHQITHTTLPVWATQYTGGLKATGLALPVVCKPQLPAYIADAVAVQVTHALQFPLGMLEVKEQCGHVYLVATKERHVTVDPELPIALLNLGDKYARAFARYAQHLTTIGPYFDRGMTERWWKRAHRLCGKCLAALEQVADKITIEELVYLVLKLQQPLAWPTGKTERDSLAF